MIRGFGVRMTTPRLPEWLVRVIVVLAIPAVACFGYYALEDAGEAQSAWGPAVILAYPMALIGFIGLAMALLSPSSSRLKYGLWTLCILVPALFFLWVRA